MSIIQKVKTAAFNGCVALAVTAAPIMAFAEDVDPTAAASTQISKASAWGMALGGAVLGVIAAISSIKYIRRAL